MLKKLNSAELILSNTTAHKSKFDLNVYDRQD